MGSKHLALVYVRVDFPSAPGLACMQASLRSVVIAGSSTYAGLCFVAISANKMFRADACVLWTKVL